MKTRKVYSIPCCLATLAKGKLSPRRYLVGRGVAGGGDFFPYGLSTGFEEKGVK